MEEVRHLAANGYREVVLTGIHLSSYGIDLDEEIGLLELIRACMLLRGSNGSVLDHWSHVSSLKNLHAVCLSCESMSSFSSVTAKRMR